MLGASAALQLPRPVSGSPTGVFAQAGGERAPRSLWCASSLFASHVLVYNVSLCLLLAPSALLSSGIPAHQRGKEGESARYEQVGEETELWPLLLRQADHRKRQQLPDQAGDAEDEPQERGGKMRNQLDSVGNGVR